MYIHFMTKDYLQLSSKGFSRKKYPVGSERHFFYI